MNMHITFPLLVLDGRVAREAFLRYPDSVLLQQSDRPPYNRLLAVVARQCRVPSVVVQHGILTEFDCNKTFEADYYAVWGDKEVDWFRAQGPGGEAGRIHVTGNPIYDGYLSATRAGRSEVLGRFGLEPDKKVVLVLTQWTRDQIISFKDMQDLFMIDVVVEALKRTGARDVTLVIKPHPAGNTELLRTYLALRGGGSVGVDLSLLQGDIGLLLQASDVCVSPPTSTTVLDAMMFGKPTIVYDRFTKRDVAPYVRMGAALQADSPEEMARALGALLYNTEAVRDLLEKQRAYIKYAAYKLDGGATGRVRALVEAAAEGLRPQLYM